MRAPVTSTLAAAAAAVAALTAAPTAAATEVIAHRGLGAGPAENTVTAIRQAVRSGAALVEVDVRATRDARPRLLALHDATLGRTTTCRGAVADRTARSIRRNCRTRSGHRIPTLAGVLRAVRGAGAGLLLELKPGMTPAHARAAMRRVRAHGLAGRTVVQSFDPRLLRAAMRAAPEVPGWILAPRPDHPRVARAERAGAAGVAARYATLLDAGSVAALAARGLAVAAWTADDPEAWCALAAAGVDAIVTNRPGALAAALPACGAS